LVYILFNIIIYLINKRYKLSFINPVDTFISLGRHIASNSGLSAGVNRLNEHLQSYATPRNKAIAAVAVTTVTAAAIHPVSRPYLCFLLGVTGSLSLIILNLVVLGLTAATLLIKAGKGVAKAGTGVARAAAEGAGGFTGGAQKKSRKDSPAAEVTQVDKPAPKSSAVTSTRSSVVEVDSTALSKQADDLVHQDTSSNQAPKTVLELDTNVRTTNDEEEIPTIADDWEANLSGAGTNIDQETTTVPSESHTNGFRNAKR
jgi:hypothetical protein